MFYTYKLALFHVCVCAIFWWSFSTFCVVAKSSREIVSFFIGMQYTCIARRAIGCMYTVCELEQSTLWRGVITTPISMCVNILFTVYIRGKRKKKKKKMPLWKKILHYCNLWTHRCILFCNNRIDSKSKSNVAAYGPTRKVIKVPNKTQQQDSNHHIIKCYSTTYFCIFI